MRALLATWLAMQGLWSFGQTSAQAPPVLPIGISLPAAWARAEAPKPGSSKGQAWAFVRQGPLRGVLEIEVERLPSGLEGEAGSSWLRQRVLAAQSEIRAAAVEKDSPLRPLTGAQGHGWFWVATDKHYRKPPGGPVPGEFPVVTRGDLIAGHRVLSFWIYSDAAEDLATREALDALRRASPRP